MASATIDEAKIEISIDKASIEGIKKDLEAIRTNTDAKIKKTFKAANIAALAAKVQWGAKELFLDFVSGTKAIGRFSDMLGTSVGSMDALMQAAGDFGLEINDAGNAFIDIQKNAFEFITKGTGPFAELSQSPLFDASRLTDSKGHLKDINEILYAVSDALAGMGEGQSAALAGRAGITDPKMIAFLRQGSNAIKGASEMARKYGVRTDQDVEVTKEFTSALRALQNSVHGVLIPLIQMMNPALIALAKSIKWCVNNATFFYPILSGIIVLMGKAFGPAVLAWVKSIGVAVKSFALALNISFGWLTVIAVALLAIGYFLDDFVGWMNGKESKFGDIWESWFGSVENAKEKVSGLWNVVKSLFKTVLLFSGATAIIGIITKIGFAIYGLVTAITAFGVATNIAIWPIIAVLAGLAIIIGALIYYWDDLREAGNNALGSIMAGCNAFSEGWNNLINTIATAWETAINGAIGFWDYFFERVFGGIKSLKESISELADKFSFASAEETVSGWGDKIKSIFPDTMPNLSAIAGNTKTENNVKIDANVNVNGAQDPKATADKVVNGIKTSSWDDFGHNNAVAT